MSVYQHPSLAKRIGFQALIGLVVLIALSAWLALSLWQRLLLGLVAIVLIYLFVYRDRARLRLWITKDRIEEQSKGLSKIISLNRIKRVAVRCSTAKVGWLFVIFSGYFGGNAESFGGWELLVETEDGLFVLGQGLSYAQLSLAATEIYSEMRLYFPESFAQIQLTELQKEQAVIKEFWGK